MGVREPVTRDVEADELGLGQQQLELVQQKALAAADVEDANLALEAVQIDQRLRDRLPAALDVAIAAIAVAPVAVPVVGLVFLGLEHAVDLLVHHAADIVPLGHLVQRGDDVEQTTH